ncbi:hypothetical protein HDU76_004424 [Blyttiomyces sp. JEL0837]|nr:hypothetical protein HDU76_004424 [Blyttiomyces sp. JEL0837]
MIQRGPSLQQYQQQRRSTSITSSINNGNTNANIKLESKLSTSSKYSSGNSKPPSARSSINRLHISEPDKSSPQHSRRSSAISVLRKNTSGSIGPGPEKQLHYLKPTTLAVLESKSTMESSISGVALDLSRSSFVSGGSAAVKASPNSSIYKIHVVGGNEVRNTDVRDEVQADSTSANIVSHLSDERNKVAADGQNTVRKKLNIWKKMTRFFKGSKVGNGTV